MPDGGRVLLTTDTTVERRDRQERALVATAMAQVGDSIEITDTDYRLALRQPGLHASSPAITAEEVLGRTPGELLRSDAHAPEFYAEIDRDDPCGSGVEGPDRQPPQVGQPDPPGRHHLAGLRTSPAS